jgi:hypothetical protein
MSLIPLGFWAASGGGDAAAFDLLETTTLATSASSVTFSGLAAYSGWSHLQIRMAVKTNRASTSDYAKMIFNTDTGSNYSWHNLEGNGSSVASSAGSNQTFMQINRTGGSSGNFGAIVSDILDAFETSKYTTIRNLGGYASDNISLSSGSWRNTDSLTSVQILPGSGSNFVANCRFSIYGVL